MLFRSIPALEAEANRLTLEMAKPKIASDFEKLNALAQKHGETEKNIQKLYAEWESASEALK